MKIYPRNLPSTAVICSILVGVVTSQYYYQRMTNFLYSSSHSETAHALSSGPTDAANFYFLIGDNARWIATTRVQVSSSVYALANTDENRNCVPARSSLILS